jgi:hypothetical protein
MLSIVRADLLVHAALLKNVHRVAVHRVVPVALDRRSTDGM